MTEVVNIDMIWEAWTTSLMWDIVPIDEDHYNGDECRCKPSINKFVTHLPMSDKEWYVFSHNPYRKSIPTKARDDFLSGLYVRNSQANDMNAKARKEWDDHNEKHGTDFDFGSLV